MCYFMHRTLRSLVSTFLLNVDLMNSPQLAGSTSVKSHISSTALQKIRVAINIYDLLPPGKLSSILWACGSALLHSGVVISDREYAYGGHDCRGVTGIYYTPPRTVPPGGTFRCELLHGFTVRTLNEIDDIIKEASDFFKGTSYNILTRNCNHFTSYLLEKLTSRPGPAWLNRAASIGVALPCVVPREWIAPPDFETVDGELLDYDEPESSHEQSRMLENTDSSNCTSVKTYPM
ncbi:DeSI-like protein sdu1 [Golovinomyces cichoracearum]|uniref:DeSI-like protein sdu1 n=1 Tax=Golovinomyces cichoracearum TaxID=62708 RepID=A0A420HXG9_9PEZI|nr:DeSI-like protein sdu1 [Golovinomyces cichoracearum]